MTTLTTDFTHVYAEPGSSSIIDAINPRTGLTVICGDTAEQVQARYPNARMVAWADWQAEQVAKQQAPIAWEPSTSKQYHDMLNCLPPQRWIGGAFLVGEPCDHSIANGRPRYQAYRQRGDVFEVASRPMTTCEFRDEVGPCGEFVALVNHNRSYRGTVCCTCGHDEAAHAVTT
jgi:hypothetical protein